MARGALVALRDATVNSVSSLSPSTLELRPVTSKGLFCCHGGFFLKINFQQIFFLFFFFFEPEIPTRFDCMCKGWPRLSIDNNAGDSGRRTYGLHVLYVLLH